jgi:hypothetical protein
MKNRIFAAPFVLALLTSAAAFGQSSAKQQVDIPFEFHVGPTVLPAGQYTVHPQYANGVLALRGYGRGAMIATDNIEVKKAPDTGKLVFNRYGDTYFLSKVFMAGETRGRALRKTQLEREIASNSPPAKPTEVTLARR